MKSEFSTSWIGSRQIRKQRKFRFNAPLHLRHKFLSSNLSKELRKKHGKRNLPVRKGDEVLVMRGSFAKKKGKVLEVDLKRSKIAVEGINRSKRDGTKVNVLLDASKLQILSLNLDDKKRMKNSNTKEGKTEKKEHKAETKKEVKEKKDASN
jgi:large subunit ribosomal protein L24